MEEAYETPRQRTSAANTKVAPRRTNRLVRKAIGWTLLTTPILGGTFIGASLADLSEAKANAQDVREAQGYERCIAFEQAMGAGNVVLRASQIPVETQIDCGMRDAITSLTERIEKELSYPNSGALDGSTVILNTDPVVTLPTIATLQQAQHDTFSASEGTGYGQSIIYGSYGAFLGICAIGGIVILRDHLARNELLESSSDSRELEPIMGRLTTGVEQRIV